MYRYLICPYTSALAAGCCACNKAGAISSATAAIVTANFEKTDLAHFNMVTLSNGK
jgi:hypothetical protein